MLPRSIYIGFDSREFPAFSVAKESFRLNMNNRVSVRGVLLSDLQREGLYTRPIEVRIGAWTDRTGRKWGSSEPVFWDDISQHTMSTEFAISRFLVPELVRRATKPGRALGWALFVDCDVLVRRNIDDLFNYRADLQQYALLCVRHDYTPKSTTKMDGQIQAAYAGKNQSSVMMFNCDHPANRALTVDMVNTLPGRDLHRFCWLKPDEIGYLSPEYNYLIGEEMPADIDPRIAHFTNGGPWMRGYENVPYADEWRAVRDTLVR